MKRFRITLITTFVLASAVAAMAQSVRTDFDHSFNLARLKTYDFSPETRSPGDPLAGSPLNDRRISGGNRFSTESQPFREFCRRTARLSDLVLCDHSSKLRHPRQS